MKLNIAYPATGCQKCIEVEDDKKLQPFFDKRMSNEVEGDSLGDEWKGYVFRIAGGNDLQGFPMKQGVLKAGRTRLLLKKGHSCFRERRRGEMKRKSVRGCIVGPDLSVLTLVVVKKGEGEIEGLTQTTKPRLRGPKTVSGIRRLFELEKKDDVTQYVVRRLVEKGDKKRYKAPRIQRLVTPRRLQHKRQNRAVKRKRYTATRAQAEDFNKLIAQRAKEARVDRELKKRRTSSRKVSEKKN
jgi:small subunit ribosomal protein S6e|mmetsp:Transcript_127456/g.309796  ORF Transcript_127456/g.309796 Transcript_127456/m.309796 type:complete len:241 (-) Transcript_127456:28-750(-)